MKLYAPTYYKKFKCIADKCEHSCCIGWEIDIDGDTVKKYEQLKGGYGDVIRGSISYDGEPHFKLCRGDRCPHLNERGLCKIILNCGEDHLCSICREHPRFYNFTEIAEVGLGMSCPEAARVVLSSSDYWVMEEIGEIAASEDFTEFDALCERRKIYEVLRQRGDSFTERLAKISVGYGVSPMDDALWLERLADLEYLDEDHKGLFMSYSSTLRPGGNDEYLERFLAYLIYRHCTEASDADDFLSRLSFCLFCEQLLSSLICHTGADSLNDVAALASIISEEIEYSEDNTASLMYY